MIETIGYILVQIFDYFFAQNAPMTLTFVGSGAFLSFYLQRREIDIVAPLELSAYKAELMKRQMNMADGFLDQLHAKLYGLYRHERKGYLEAEGLSHDDARTMLETDKDTFMHSLQLWGVHGVIRSEVRNYFRDNHLAELTEKEFKAYLELRTENVWDAMVLAMTEYWFSGMNRPNRSDVYDCHEKNKDQILEIVRRIFSAGRDIALESYAKLPTLIRKRWKKIKVFF